MTFQKRSCFQCGDTRHFAATCPSDERLCYNCHGPGHESSNCPSPRSVEGKQCYSCGGVGHIQADCPNLKLQNGNNSKCHSCGRVGHFFRSCHSGTGFVSRAPPPGRGLNMAAIPIKCFRCNGPNHMAKDCLATPSSLLESLPSSNLNRNKNKTCYKCNTEGHIARDCPENADWIISSRHAGIVDDMFVAC